MKQMEVYCLLMKHMHYHLMIIKIHMVKTMAASELIERELGVDLQKAVSRFVALSSSAVEDATARGTTFSQHGHQGGEIYKSSGDAVQKALTFISTQLAWIKTPVGSITSEMPEMKANTNTFKNLSEGQVYYESNVISYDGEAIRRLILDLQLNPKNKTQLRHAVAKYTRPYWTTFIELATFAFSRCLTVHATSLKEITAQNTLKPGSAIFSFHYGSFGQSLLEGISSFGGGTKSPRQADGDITAYNAVSAFCYAMRMSTGGLISTSQPTLPCPETWNGRGSRLLEFYAIHFARNPVDAAVTFLDGTTPIFDHAAFEVAWKNNQTSWEARVAAMSYPGSAYSTSSPVLGKFLKIPASYFPNIADEIETPKAESDVEASKSDVLGDVFLKHRTQESMMTLFQKLGKK